MQILKLTKLNHAMNTFCPLHIYYRQSALPNHLKIVDRLNFEYGFIFDFYIRNFTCRTIQVSSDHDFDIKVPHLITLQGPV